MCDRPDFDRAQNEATKLLLLQNVINLFIDVRTFSFKKKIHIDSIQNYAHIVKRPISDFVCDEFSGCCMIPYPRCNLVLFDDTETNDYRKHWGIVHEIGHIYLNHETDGEKEEKEANFFAAQVVAPEIILCDIRRRQGFLGVDDLLSHFNISREAVSKRITTLERRRCYSNTKIDKLLLAKMSSVLDKELSMQHKQRANYGDTIDWDDEICFDRRVCSIPF